MIPHLPAQGSARMKHAHTLGDYPGLSVQILVEVLTSFIVLSQVVRWRRHYELHGLVAETGQEIQIVDAFNYILWIGLRHQQWQGG
jgi:hypothetical protein